MDFFAQRHAAHIESAIHHERSAELHSALSECLQLLGDEINASRALQLADDHRREAAQERIYASQVERTEEIVLPDIDSIGA